ncbi:hypothetical protein CROQUDRAFT_722340 [Cronartium quercuum f. sp. fusiforme G11]|uniref:Uncharacterized protein n=1 Tax=Cronartium quercuum f. sp. fusiforme G11 TaxID=708437 RepID=A0A9P6TE17_9BASI|nr:hypothetical protein CROQUDRAFT_722340 [Cronartium quercuum f. sp. fusiforme G11]
MATENTLAVPLNEPHAPDTRGFELFEHLAPKIQHELIRLRHHWDKHEPRMFSETQGISDHDLANFNVRKDLVLIRSGQTSFGTVVFGKLRIPAFKDKNGQGFIHVRVHDPVGNGMADVILHAILTDEVKKNGVIVDYRLIMRQEDALIWFNE